MEKREPFYWIIIALLIITIGCVLGYYQKPSWLSASQMISQNLKKDNLPPTIVGRNSSDSSIIAFQKQIILNQTLAGRLGFDKIYTELGEIKKIQSQIQFELKYGVYNKTEPMDPNDIVSVGDSIKALKLPHTVLMSEKDLYAFSLTLTPKEKRLDSLVLYDNSQITLGFKPRGFFRRSEPSILFQNRNKYLSGFNMNNVVVNRRKPFYETRIFNMCLGVATYFAAQKGIEKLKLK